MRLDEMATGQRFRSEQYLGMVLTKQTDPTGQVTRVQVRVWDTTDRALVRIDGREFPAMKRRDQDWAISTTVTPISIVEFQAISQQRPPDAGTLPRVEASPEPDEEDSVPLAEGDPAEPEPVITPPIRKARKPKPEPKLVSQSPPTSEIEKTTRRANPCICGCGELCEKTLKRGHQMRLRNWADDIRRGKLAQSDIPKPALIYMLEKGVL